jgi:hypothetical protein
MSAKRSFAAPLGVCFLLLLPWIYIGSYCALVEREESASSIRVARPHNFWVYDPEYRTGGSAAEWIFAPIWFLDWRVFRPSYWEYPSID